MPILRFALGLLLAITVYTAALWLDRGVGRFFDPFLILVLYHAIRSTPLASAFGGSVAGLVHDAMTGGIYGLHGFADTLVAYVTAAVRQRFVVQRPLQVALVCLLAAAGQAATLALLQSIMLARADLPQPLDSAVSALTTSLFGALIFVLSGHFFAWERRWREHRRHRLRLDT